MLNINIIEVSKEEMILALDGQFKQLSQVTQRDSNP